MKKKTGYLIVLAVFCLFAVSAAYALDLQSHDFDGHFTMDVPKDASIKKVNESYEGGVVYTDSKNNINITYTDSVNYEGGLHFSADPGTSMSKRGNYSVVEFPDGSNMVTLKNESGMVMIRGKMSVDDMISMLDTVKFN